MSQSLQLKLKRKLQELKSKPTQQQTYSGTSCDSCGTEFPARSRAAKSLPQYLVGDRTLAEREADLVLFALFYLNDRHNMYIDYMKKANLLGANLIGQCGDTALGRFKPDISGSDVCLCGAYWGELSQARIRDYCGGCEGRHIEHSFAYEFSRLEVAFKVHPSWLEVAFATAIKLRKLSGKV